MPRHLLIKSQILWKYSRIPSQMFIAQDGVAAIFKESRFLGGENFDKFSWGWKIGEMVFELGFIESNAIKSLTSIIVVNISQKQGVNI
jgi:hypothetical protein